MYATALYTLISDPVCAKWSSGSTIFVSSDNEEICELTPKVTHRERRELITADIYILRIYPRPPIASYRNLQSGNAIWQYEAGLEEPAISTVANLSHLNSKSALYNIFSNRAKT